MAFTLALRNLVHDKVRLAADPARLHYFDAATGQAVRAADRRKSA